MRYTVNVDNIGTVHVGNNRRKALATAKEYADTIVQGGEGRGGLPVVCTDHGEPIKEYALVTVLLCGILSDGEGWSVDDIYRAETVALPIDASNRQILREVRNAFSLSTRDRLTPLGEGFWRIQGSTLAITVEWDY